MSAGAITLLVEDPGWRKPRGLVTALAPRRRGRAGRIPASRAKLLTVLLSNDEKLQSLNRDFRGKNKPTNVLSFPAAGEMPTAIAAISPSPMA